MQAVTAGRLLLCEENEIYDLVSGKPIFEVRLSDAADIAMLRERLRGLCRDIGLTDLRADDLCLSASEAAANAVKHATGGTCRVWSEIDTASVMIEDCGTGIDASDLARATLEMGYSTKTSLGMGFHLMLDTADLLALSTSSSGTKVLVQVRRSTFKTLTDSLMDRYARSEGG